MILKFIEIALTVILILIIKYIDNQKVIISISVLILTYYILFCF